MSLRSEICARLLLPLIVTLLTVLAVFKLSGTDLHFAKYCAESTLVYAAVLLFPFIIRTALWGIFQFIVALQMCSIVSTGIYIVPLTVMNLSSHNAIGVKAQIWLAFIFAIVFFPSFFAIFSTKNVKVKKNIYMAAGSVVGVLMITLAFTQNSVLKNTKHLAKAVLHDVYFVPKQNAAIREQYRKPAVVSQSQLETAGANYFSPDTPIKNVIVIFVEGFSAEVVNYKNHSSRNLTPTYDQLYKNSLAFDHYYNHTYATYRGLRGQLYSLWQYKAGFYPDVGNQGFGQMDHEKIHKLTDSGLVSVPEILNQHHFNTYFLSNELRTGNMTSYLKTFAFTRVYGADDLGWTGDPPRSDKFAFQSLKQVLTEYKSDKPFFIGMYTAGTHHGVDSPDLTYGDGSNSYYNKFHNLDHWLGDFIAWFKTSPYYDNTLLVITSDHGVVIPTPEYRRSFHQKTERSNFEIPLILYGKMVKPQIVDAKGTTSISLAPTLLDVLGIRKTEQYFLGCSLFETQCDERSSRLMHHFAAGTDSFRISANERGKYIISPEKEDAEFQKIYRFTN